MPSNRFLPVPFTFVRYKISNITSQKHDLILLGADIPSNGGVKKRINASPQCCQQNFKVNERALTQPRKSGADGFRGTGQSRYLMARDVARGIGRSIQVRHLINLILATMPKMRFQVVLR